MLLQVREGLGLGRCAANQCRGFTIPLRGKALGRSRTTDEHLLMRRGSHLWARPLRSLRVFLCLQGTLRSSSSHSASFHSRGLRGKTTPLGPMTVDGLLQGAENIWGPNGFWWEFETDPLSLELLMGERDHAGWRRGYPTPAPRPKEGRKAAGAHPETAALTAVRKRLTAEQELDKRILGDLTGTHSWKPRS